MGVFTGVDDLALAVHDTVDGDARNDIGLDELKLVYKLCRGPWELGLVVQGWELLLLSAGVLGREAEKCCHQEQRKLQQPQASLLASTMVGREPS